jgi:predicted dehydrogenase
MEREVMIASETEGLETDQLRVGLLGTGAIAQRLHAPGYREHEGATVTAVCDLEEQKARAIAERVDADHVFTDFEKLVRSGTVDAVSVCLPNNVHADATTTALDADLHALCEKPMATTLAEADEMVAAADRSEGSLMVNQTERFAPVFQKAVDVLESGLVGEVQTIRSRFSHTGPEGWSPRSTWFTDEAASGGGAMVDIGIHNADLVLSLVDGVDSVTAEMATLEMDVEVEDTVVATMRLDGGGLGTFEVSWTTDPPQVETQVVGTEGVLTADGIDGELTVELDDVRGTVDVPLPEYRSPVKRFVDAVLAGRDVPVTASEGREALELVTAMDRAAGRRRPVALPLEGSR